MLNYRNMHLICYLIFRVAIPFGGFGISPKVPVKSVQMDAVPSFSSQQSVETPTEPAATRPSFNRSALGWVADSAPLLLPAATLELKPSNMPMFIPESDEL